MCDFAAGCGEQRFHPSARRGDQRSEALFHNRAGNVDCRAFRATRIERRNDLQDCGRFRHACVMTVWIARRPSPISAAAGSLALLSFGAALWPVAFPCRDRFCEQMPKTATVASLAVLMPLAAQAANADVLDQESLSGKTRYERCQQLARQNAQMALSAANAWENDGGDSAAAHCAALALFA